LQQLPITLTLKAGATEADYSATTNSNGSFTVNVDLPSGTYAWRVKGQKFLANSGTLALVRGASSSEEFGLMRAGDANDDNIITIQDFTILKTTFGRGNGDPGYDERADFTGDQSVNIQDFNLLKGNFGVQGAPPTAPFGERGGDMDVLLSDDK
jgi:hypothetical protein